MRSRAGLRSVLALLFVCGLAGNGLAGVDPDPEAPPLRLGVVSFYNPRLMYLKYQPLVDYLDRHTRRRWELSISTSYQDTVDRLCADELTLAYLGPFTYLRAREGCGAEALVRLDTGGRDSYRSYVMVRDDSPLSSLADLAGRDFGFGSPLSTSSHVMPRSMLARAGLVVGRDLGCRYYGHHERAARAVLMGEVAACGVRDLVGKQFEQRGLRILARSEPIPNFPLAVGPGADPELRRVVVEALVHLPARDSAARALLASWDAELADGFAVAKDSAYDPVLALARVVFGPRALVLPEAGLLCSERR